MHQEAIQDLKEQTAILVFLKHVFWAEPNKSFIAEIQSLPDVQAEDDQNDLDRGLILIMQSLDENSGRVDAYLEELAVEFARLFIGPKKPSALPYASFFLSESRVMMSDVTSDVRKTYLSAGMALKDLYRFPDDHIAIEIEFLEHLARKIVELFDAKQTDEASRLFEIRAEFLVDHFSRWVPDFADAILKVGPNDFYRGAALMAKGFIALH